MEVVLTSGNSQAATDKLQEMERSLIVLKVFFIFEFFVFYAHPRNFLRSLKSLPEYEANRDLLLRLQTRFQASLSPQVIAAVTDRDVQK